MKILYENFGGYSGALSGYIYLLRALVQEYPEDEYLIHCVRGSGLDKLKDLPNVQILYMNEFVSKEFMRFYHNQWNINNIVRRYRPDLILSTNIGPYIRTGIPQVLHLMNAFQWCDLSKIKYHPQGKLFIFAMRLFFRRSLRKCDVAVVESPLVRDEVGKIRGAPSRIEVIPKAVENEYDLLPQALPETVSRFFNDKLGKEFFTFLYVATYSPHKNFKILISAIQILKDRGVKARLALSLTKDDLAKYFGQQATDLVASGHLLPLGWVHKEYLYNLYHSCSACVMPSLLECLSGAYLESMNWGKAQICSDLPFARDTCGSASIYADPENHRDWADKMLKLMEDRPLRDMLVQEGYKRIKQFPATWVDVAKKAHSVFESMMSHGNAY